ncbi:MAG TPA: hypothetical protein VGD64_03090 [Acidisarcina sp.]
MQDSPDDYPALLHAIEDDVLTLFRPPQARAKFIAWSSSLRYYCESIATFL